MGITHWCNNIIGIFWYLFWRNFCWFCTVHCSIELPVALLQSLSDYTIFLYVSIFIESIYGYFMVLCSLFCFYWSFKCCLGFFYVFGLFDSPTIFGILWGFINQHCSIIWYLCCLGLVYLFFYILVDERLLLVSLGIVKVLFSIFTIFLVFLRYFCSIFKHFDSIFLVYY